MIDVEVFACSGGMADGFRRAGIEFDLVIDKDPNACASYEANLGHRPIQIDVRDFIRLVRASGWSTPVRLLVADPPCTPYSTAGKGEGLDDERDCLRETVELVRLLRPLACLIGNVPGLETEKHRKALHDTIGSLSRDGYCTADAAVLDSADWGVPQHRVRPFWFLHRVGECIRWPVRTHGPRTSTIAIAGTELQPHVTCRDALGHLPPDEIGQRVRVRWKPDSDHRVSSPDDAAKTLTTNTHSDGALIEWPWDRPATTVTCRAGLAPPGHHPESGSIMSQPNAIKLGERAAAILQGFPEEWAFRGATKKARWGQIGMAMPPPLAHAVAGSIARWFDALDVEAAAERQGEPLEHGPHEPFVSKAKR